MPGFKCSCCLCLPSTDAGITALPCALLGVRDVTGASFLMAFVPVHISTDPRRHPCDRWSLPVPSAAARGRVSQGECRRLPRQPGCALEPGHRHRESTENGGTAPLHILSSLLFILDFSRQVSIGPNYMDIFFSYCDSKMCPSPTYYYKKKSVFMY